MKANQRVPAPRGRRTHSFGSTWRRSRGKLLLWMFLHQTIAFADAGIGKCRLRRHSRAFIYVVARIVLAQQQRGYPGNAELVVLVPAFDTSVAATGQLAAAI